MIRFVLPFVGVLFMFTYCVLGNSQNQGVASYILEEYDSRVAPEFTNVNISVALRRIVDLDVNKRELTIDAWFEIYWEDSRLAWTEEEEFVNTTRISLPSSSVWIPDIHLYNSANGFVTYDKGVNVIVNNDGHLFYIPPVQFKSYCDAGNQGMCTEDVTCSLKFGSWVHDGNHLNLDVQNAGFSVDQYIGDGSSHWSFQNMSYVRNVKSYACCPEPYVDVTYSFILHRH